MCISSGTFTSQHAFQSALLIASGKEQFVFDWDAERFPIGRRSFWEKYSAYTTLLEVDLDARDPIEFFLLSINSVKPIPADRCSEIADALEDLVFDQSFSTAIKNHLNDHVNDLRVCAMHEREFRYFDFRYSDR